MLVFLCFRKLFDVLDWFNVISSMHVSIVIWYLLVLLFFVICYDVMVPFLCLHSTLYGSRKLENCRAKKMVSLSMVMNKENK